MTPVEHFIYHLATWTCVTASVVLKMPQLISVVTLKSAEGISTQSLMMEMWSLTTQMMYQIAENIPLLQYIDYILLMAQEVPLFFLVLYYNRHFNLASLSYCIAFVSVFGSMYYGWTSTAINIMLINIDTPIGLFGKATQIYEMYRQKSAGCVSATSWFLAAYTCYARIVTLYLEAPDVFLMVLFGVSGIFNMAIMLTAMYYNSKKSQKLE